MHGHCSTRVREYVPRCMQWVIPTITMYEQLYDSDTAFLKLICLHWQYLPLSLRYGR